MLEKVYCDKESNEHVLMSKLLEVAKCAADETAGTTITSKLNKVDSLEKVVVTEKLWHSLAFKNLPNVVQWGI